MNLCTLCEINNIISEGVATRAMAIVLDNLFTKKDGTVEKLLQVTAGELF